MTDARGKFSRVSGGGVDVRYAYNGLGERVSKGDATGTMLFVQEGYKIVGEYLQNGQLLRETVYLDGLPVGVIKTSGLYYVNPDPLGSPLAITNTAGTPVWSWEHAPFGDTLPNENPKGAGRFVYNLRFPGQYFDSETGSHYNNARTYLPDMGFYQQPDPIGLNGGINPYAYVGENPVNAVDQWGLDWIVVQYPGHGINFFGHTGIGPSLANSSVPTVGFYPAPSISYWNEIRGEDIPGELRRDSTYSSREKEFTLQTTACQDYLIEVYLKDIVDHPPNFNVYSRNCAQTAEDAFRFSGVPAPNNILFPSDMSN